MENYLSNVPAWVSISFSFVFPITIYFIAKTVKQGAVNAQIADNQANKLFWGVVLFFTLYLIYVSGLAFTFECERFTAKSSIIYCITAHDFLFRFHFQ
jgi:hypothetical protein